MFNLLIYQSNSKFKMDMKENMISVYQKVNSL